MLELARDTTIFLNENAGLIAVASLMVSALVTLRQFSLGKRSIVQGEYGYKDKVAQTTINLITKGSKYEFDDETVEEFWKITVAGRHLFDTETSKFIEECGQRYYIALEAHKKDPIGDPLTVDSAGHWFWHQRSVAHEKFDKYFSKNRF